MKNRKYSHVAAELRRRIARGEFSPGERLPGARRLAAQFGVSTITTTRALNELERLGVVERRERSGTYVRSSAMPLESVILIVSTGLESVSTACIDYWRGVSSAAEARGVPVRLARGEDPALPELLVRQPSRRIGIVGVLTAPAPALWRRIEATGAPYVSLGMEDLAAAVCVTEDRRRACRALVMRMAAAGCRHFGFIGNFRASNHVLARVAFVDTVRALPGVGEPVVRDASDATAADAAAALLAGHPLLDAVVIMGGNMPVAALPAVLGCGRPVAVGVMAENSAVLQLCSMAYVAAYSQEASGRLAFETLSRLADGELSGSATFYPPFEILAPGGSESTSLRRPER
jgi:DNA-binding transcriptional regulator YhcF (GntR family)